MDSAMTADTRVVASSVRRRGRYYHLRRFSFISLNYLMLTIIGLISSIPLFWMISTSLKESGKEFRFPPELIPYPVAWNNYIDVWGDTGIHQFFLNSVFITVLATIGTLITSSMVAFGFARINFPGRGPLFVLMLSTMMLPGIVTLVPQFVLFRYMKWIDTPLPLIVPFWFGGGAFFIFLVRQFMLQLPKELDEAALADGASYLRIYWNIILPLTGPGARNGGHILGPVALERVHISAHIPQQRDVADPGSGSAVVPGGRVRLRGHPALESVDGVRRHNAGPDSRPILRRATVFHQGNCAQRTDRTLAPQTVVPSEAEETSLPPTNPSFPRKACPRPDRGRESIPPFGHRRGARTALPPLAAAPHHNRQIQSTPSRSRPKTRRVLYSRPARVVRRSRHRRPPCTLHIHATP